LKMPEHVEIRGATETGRSDIGSRDSVQQLQYELQQQELVESRPLRWVKHMTVCVYVCVRVFVLYI